MLKLIQLGLTLTDANGNLPIIDGRYCLWQFNFGEFNLNNVNYSLDFELSDNNYIPNLFGVDDKNIHIIEKVNNVQIKYRGNKIKIIGEIKKIENTKIELQNLFEDAKKGIEIDEDKIKDTKSILSLNIKDSSQLDLFIQTKKRKKFYC